MLSSFHKDKTKPAGLPSYGSFTGWLLSGDPRAAISAEEAAEIDKQNDLPRGRREGLRG